MSAFQVIAIILLVVYVIGALYYLVGISFFMARRKRNNEVSLLVDVLARIVTVINVTFFWPLHLNH